jgi:L-rhamnose mutarotase
VSYATIGTAPYRSFVATWSNVPEWTSFASATGSYNVQKQSENSTADLLPQTEIVRKWWKFMAEIMETNPDNSPLSLPLIEVFHQD